MLYRKSITNSALRIPIPSTRIRFPKRHVIVHPRNHIQSNICTNGITIIFIQKSPWKDFYIHHSIYCTLTYKRYSPVMLIRFSSSLMNGFSLSLRRLSSMIYWNSFTEGERNPQLFSVHSMIHPDGTTSSAAMIVRLLRPSSTGLNMMPTRSISYRLPQQTISL